MLTFRGYVPSHACWVELGLCTTTALLPDHHCTAMALPFASRPLAEQRKTLTFNPAVPHLGLG